MDPCLINIYIHVRKKLLRVHIVSNFCCWNFQMILSNVSVSSCETQWAQTCQTFNDSWMIENVEPGLYSTYLLVVNYVMPINNNYLLSCFNINFWSLKCIAYLNIIHCRKKSYHFQNSISLINLLWHNKLLPFCCSIFQIISVVFTNSEWGKHITTHFFIGAVRQCSTHFKFICNHCNGDLNNDIPL